MNTPLRGNRSGIKFSKDTPTYQMFEKLFLDLGEERLPFVLPGLRDKGKVINLAMGLNRCHIQWGQEQGIPREMLTRSAKAKEGPTGDWFLEVSKNERWTRKGPDWMKDLVASLAPNAEPSVLPQTPQTPPAEPDPVADAIRSTYGDIL